MVIKENYTEKGPGNFILKNNEELYEKMNFERAFQSSSGWKNKKMKNCMKQKRIEWKNKELNERMKKYIWNNKELNKRIKNYIKEWRIEWKNKELYERIKKYMKQ